MDREMMLFQARQDFIDLHDGLQNGESCSFAHYVFIVDELKKMDADNFEQMLTFTEKTNHIPIRTMWKQISTVIDDIQRSGKWKEKQSLRFRWVDGNVRIHG